MAAYLITGEAGTGQSSVVAELQRRGYMACEGDRTPGLTYHADCRNDHKLAISDASIGSKRCFNAEN